MLNFGLTQLAVPDPPAPDLSPPPALHRECSGEALANLPFTTGGNEEGF